MVENQAHVMDTNRAVKAEIPSLLTLDTACVLYLTTRKALSMKVFFRLFSV